MDSNHRKFSLFRHSTSTRTYPSDATVFKEGEDGRVMYAVKKGQVDIVVNGNTVDTLGEEEIFGEMALLEHGPRAATAITRGNTELVEIDENQFYTVIRQNPYFALQMMRLLSERLRKADALYRAP